MPRGVLCCTQKNSPGLEPGLKWGLKISYLSSSFAFLFTMFMAQTYRRSLT